MWGIQFYILNVPLLLHLHGTVEAGSASLVLTTNIHTITIDTQSPGLKNDFHYMCRSHLQQSGFLLGRLSGQDKLVAS